MFLFEQDQAFFLRGCEVIPFLFNLERRAEQGKEVVFVMTDSCLRAESQSFPLALCVSGIPLLAVGGAGIPFVFRGALLSV